MIKAINIETKEQFDWMVREMRGLNKLHKPKVNKSHNNKQNKPCEVSLNSSHD